MPHCDASYLYALCPPRSGKFQALDELLSELYTATDERVVICSSFTSTLDALESLIKVRAELPAANKGFANYHYSQTQSL